MDLKIVDQLKKIMEQSAATHAMWTAGSVAEGYDDELSDIDLWLDIDDGQEETVFASIEKFLQSKGKLDVNFGEGVTSPYSHRVYHIAHMNPYHYIEITLHAHSHNYEINKYGTRQIKVLFDKASHTEMLVDRKRFLIEKIELGQLSVKKEILRRQFMDAMHNYQFWLVEPIIELARIKYAPLKVTYGLKHGSRDLPKNTVAEIESLYIIGSLDDLSNKIDEVKAMVKKYS